MANTAVSINWSEINYARSFAGERPVVLGYIFTLKFTLVMVTTNTGAAYTVNADPVEGRGQHSLWTRNTSSILETRQAATETDPVI